MALGYWAIANKIVVIPDGAETVDVVVDVPSGRVVAKMTISNGKPIRGDFINVPSYQFSKSLSVEVPSRGIAVEVDLAFSGAVYATVDAAQLGLAVKPNNVQQFIQLGREVKALLGTRAHYGKYDCYGVIFFNEEPRGEHDGSDVIRQRNVTIFADGQVDRSPCGSGTCARLAVLKAQGRLGPRKGMLIHRSIIGSEFRADITSEVESPSDFPAGVPRVSGQAHLVGRMSFFIDDVDPVFPGFLLR